MKIYSVLDLKSGVYSVPHITHNEQTALREVQAALRNPMHAFSLNPDDYALFEIGDWDEETAVITPRQIPELVLGGFRALAATVTTIQQEQTDGQR